MNKTGGGRGTNQHAVKGVSARRVPPRHMSRSVGMLGLGAVAPAVAAGQVQAAARLRPLVHRQARAAGMWSRRRYRTKIESRLAEVVKVSEVRTRIDSADLVSALTDGRFKSLFETGHSRGSNDVGARAAVEAHLFGYGNIDPTLRPIYTYLWTGPEPRNNTDLDPYGDAIVIFHDHVKARSTFLIGDSLDQLNRTGRIEPWIAASTMSEPHWTSTSFPVRVGERNDPLNVGPNLLDPPWYVEAHIHGGDVATDNQNIKTVHFFDPADAAVVGPLLNAKGIPWTN